MKNNVPTDSHQWVIDYQNHNTRYPWVFVVQSGDMKAGEGLRVTMFPHVAEWVRLGTIKQPEDPSEIQVPLVVVDEVLTKQASSELTQALTVIQKTQGLPFDEGLLMIIHMFFWLVDWDRHKLGEPSLLSCLTYGHFPEELRNDESKLMDELLRHPLTSVDKLLRLWRDSQGTLIRGLVAPKSTPGLPTYAFFPPHWHSVEDLRKLDGEDGVVSKVPVLVDADIAPLVPPMADIAKALTAFEQPSQRAHEAAADETAFQHSPDFRCVNLRGQEFGLTTSQAMVVKELWEFHQKGVPDISQDYLLVSVLNTEQKRLIDIFKKSPAWGKLIVRGRTRGTFRLNF